MDGMPFEGPTGEKLRKVLLAAVSMLALFLLFEAISVALGFPYIGASDKQAYTISVGGHGEVLAVPDIATFSFSVVSDKATVADAQTDAAATANAVTAYLTGQGIASADIQTTDYSVSPQYQYQNAVCPPAVPLPSGVSSSVAYCPPGKQVLTGYEVSQQTTVKVRDTTKAGTLLAGVGSKGATQVSGLTFTTDDPEALTAQARAKAVTDAQTQAQALAKSLGVSLGRVTSFYDDSTQGSTPSPIAMPYAMNASATGAVAPEISAGQNMVTDDVTVTYEIR